MKNLFILLPLLLLTGCATNSFKEEHELLNKAQKAEVRMDKAIALRASGVALTAKAIQDYQEAKEDRQNALQELSERITD